MENKSYESITFKVENGLVEPKHYLYSRSKDEILNSIFTRKKKNSHWASKRQVKENNEVMKYCIQILILIKKNFLIMEKSHYFVD